MRNFAFAALAAALLFSASPAFAQNAQPAGPAKVDLATVQKNIAPLAGAFGVNTPDPSQNTTTQDSSQNQDQHKTLGDVADKALNDVEAVTVKIAGTLEKMAPKVWEIMVRQQYAKAFSAPLPSLAWIAAMLLISGVGRKCWQKIPGDWSITKQDSSGKDFSEFSDIGASNLARMIVLIIIPTGISAVAVLFLFAALRDSVLYLVNPEYYAIQDLLRSIMNGGQAS